LGHADEHTLRRCLSQRRHTTFLEDGLAKLIDGTTTLAELCRASSGTVLAAPTSPLDRPDSAVTNLSGTVVK
jgi:hypothetical protein